MQLTYRAQTLTVTAGTQQRSFQPPTINWRYQVAGEATTAISGEGPQRPSAVNWRYQLPEVK